jgi:hypothetical protein
MTVKQKASRAKFTKAIAEAKKLRAKNPKLTQAAAVKQAFAILYSKDKPKKVGAVKKKAATKKKAAVKKADPKKKAAAKKLDSYHKDTKSHNVNIRVMSGISKIGNIEAADLTRINNDVNGNPRYVIHFLQILNEQERLLPFSEKYKYALEKFKQKRNCEVLI